MVVKMIICEGFNHNDRYQIKSYLAGAFLFFLGHCTSVDQQVALQMVYPDILQSHQHLQEPSQHVPSLSPLMCPRLHFYELKINKMCKRCSFECDMGKYSSRSMNKVFVKRLTPSLLNMCCIFAYRIKITYVFSHTIKSHMRFILS